MVIRRIVLLTPAYLGPCAAANGPVCIGTNTLSYYVARKRANLVAFAAVNCQ